MDKQFTQAYLDARTQVDLVALQDLLAQTPADKPLLDQVNAEMSARIAASAPKVITRHRKSLLKLGD